MRSNNEENLQSSTKNNRCILEFGLNESFVLELADEKIIISPKKCV
jgi:hypothetical protein